MEPALIRRRTLVVAALIEDERGRVLLTQRREDQPQPLYWEFPGGKIEPGEAPEAALAREIREELGLEITVGRVWDVMFHAYEEHDVYLLVYRCRPSAGAAAPRAVEVKDLAWVARAQLRDVRILPADAPLVARLASEAGADSEPPRG